MDLTNYDINNKLYRIIDYLEEHEPQAVASVLKAAAEKVLFERDSLSIAQIKAEVRTAIDQAEQVAITLVDEYAASEEMIVAYRVAMFSAKRNAKSGYNLTHGKSVFHYMQTNR